MTESPYRIFGDAVPHGDGPQRPDGSPPSLPEASLPTVVRDGLLVAVAGILDVEPEVGESVQRGFDRKERELRAFFDQLEASERATAYSRLAAHGADDALVAKLGRFSTERRQRIVASLAETPRRRAK